MYDCDNVISSIAGLSNIPAVRLVGLVENIGKIATEFDEEVVRAFFWEAGRNAEIVIRDAAEQLKAKLVIVEVFDQMGWGAMSTKEREKFLSHFTKEKQDFIKEIMGSELKDLRELKKKREILIANTNIICGMSGGTLTGIDLELMIDRWMLDTSEHPTRINRNF